MASPNPLDRHPDDPTLRPGDLPDWDLGLNLELPDPGTEPPGWFSDIERLACFLGTLAEDFGRDFVIGIGDEALGFSEDLFFVDSRPRHVAADHRRR